MRRRLLAGGLALLAFGFDASAQAVRVRRIAFFHPGTMAGFQPQLNAFRTGLKELGYIEGRDVSIEVHAGDNQQSSVPKFAAEIVAQRPDVIVTATSTAIAAFKQSTISIPIVFAASYDPVGQGFVASLRRPGGNITGVLLYEDLSPKVVEIARDALPAVHRLGILIHEPDPAQKIALKTFESAAAKHNFESIVIRVTRVEELDRAFREFGQRKAEAIVVLNNAFQMTNRRDILRRAFAARLPVFSTSDLIAESGAILSYGPPTEESWRRAATFVHKILTGSSVAELPVEQPERFLLVLNQTSAKRLGISFPPLILQRADRVID